MISIHNQQRRTLGEGGKSDVYAEVSVAFRDHLHLFRDSKLAVFMAVVLHTNKEGWCFPSLKLLAKETGYSVETVYRAIQELCKITINGHRILLKARARDTEGEFASNRYLIFPSAEEVERYESQKEVVIQAEKSAGSRKDTVTGLTRNGANPLRSEGTSKCTAFQESTTKEYHLSKEQLCSSNEEHNGVADATAAEEQESCNGNGNGSSAEAQHSSMKGVVSPLGGKNDGGADLKAAARQRGMETNELEKTYAEGLSRCLGSQVSPRATKEERGKLWHFRQRFFNGRPVWEACEALKAVMDGWDGLRCLSFMDKNGGRGLPEAGKILAFGVKILGELESEKRAKLAEERRKKAQEERERRKMESEPPPTRERKMESLRRICVNNGKSIVRQYEKEGAEKMASLWGLSVEDLLSVVGRWVQRGEGAACQSSQQT